jgi:hypothetical protein
MHPQQLLTRGRSIPAGVTRRRWLCALGAQTLVACASSSGGGVPGGPEPATEPSTIAACVTAGASYIVTARERSGGTCGPVPDSVVNTTPSGGGSRPANCTGVVREDGCDVFLEERKCPTSDGFVTQTGKISWAADGSTGKGAIQFFIVAGADSCRSTYDILYTRQ